jgi:FkbH-like protein
VTDSGKAALERLAKHHLELSEVTRLVAELEKSMASGRVVTFGISANFTVDLLATFLRKHAILHGFFAKICIGNFDDHLGNASRFASEEVDALVIANFFDAIMPAFEARVPLREAEVLSALSERFRNELRLVLGATSKIKHVFVTLLHRWHKPPAVCQDRALDVTIALFNDIIVEESARHENAHTIDSGAIASRLGWPKAHDLRSYRRFRAPFTPLFLDGIADQIYLQTRGFGAYYYKALVLDCDNTLWGGVIGEDLASGIRIGPYGDPGSLFWEVQHELLALQHRGVLLCLCTKNEPSDIDAVLASHPNMVLRDEHFVMKCANWDDKVTNLQRIATELNIGLDALVFLDDSPFECEAVRGQLPMVKTMQVPHNLSEYPGLIARIKDLFPEQGTSPESAAKTKQYRLRARAAEQRAEFATQEEYLASLRLRVTVRRNELASVARIAELTQKSNQFNLTTRRHTDREIRSFMESNDAAVYSIHVADKFGDAGLTGVVVVNFDRPARVDTFLLSCRVLGRGIETSFWNAILDDARARGCRNVTAEYLPTAKNAQVEDFWSRLGLEIVSRHPSGRREYIGDLLTLRISSPSHLEVHHDF